MLGADHHFHYGYIVYAAAVVAKFDAAWAAKHYEQVSVHRLFSNSSSGQPAHIKGDADTCLQWFAVH